MNFYRTYTLLAWGFFLLGAPAMADDSTPLFYNRDTVTVMRHQLEPVTPSPLPWQEGAGQNPAVSFQVEVRDAITYYNQKGWFNLSGLSENYGVLLLFNAPALSPVIPSNHYAPLDILMMDTEGTIVQIVPSLVLSELSQDIYPENPVLAFLFIKGGTCAAMQIKPGDSVDYKIFKKPPVVLTAPAATKPVATMPKTTAPKAPLLLPDKPQGIMR